MGNCGKSGRTDGLPPIFKGRKEEIVFLTRQDALVIAREFTLSLSFLSPVMGMGHFGGEDEPKLPLAQCMACLPRTPSSQRTNHHRTRASFSYGITSFFLSLEGRKKEKKGGQTKLLSFPRVVFPFFFF